MPTHHGTVGRAGLLVAVTGTTFAHYSMPDFCRSRALRALMKVAINSGASLALCRLDRAACREALTTVGAGVTGSREYRKAVAGIAAVSVGAAAVIESVIFRRGERHRVTDPYAHTKQAVLLAALGALGTLGLGTAD